MQRFIQLHLLTIYPPSNPNSDDNGSQKTIEMGGSQRLRISSQALKHAWRKSEVFENTLKGHLGYRTRKIGQEIYNKFIDAGIPEKNATKWAIAILSPFGKTEGEKLASAVPEDSLDAEEILPEKEEKKEAKDASTLANLRQLVFFSSEEYEAINALVEKICTSKKAPTESEIDGLLGHAYQTADIGMFGRMFADNPDMNVYASIQVSHAFTTHSVIPDFDYFTAIDDFDMTGGSAHIGHSSLGSGIFYQYLCVNTDILLKNLGGNLSLAEDAISALITAASSVSPSGKQNAFASQTVASYILCEKGASQPRTLATAFFKPIENGCPDIEDESIRALWDRMEALDTMYPSNMKPNRIEVRAKPSINSIDKLIKFATGA